MALSHDHHIHTVYSGHSAPEMTVREIIARAEKAEQKRIIILEHVPEVTGDRAAALARVPVRLLKAPIQRIAQEVHEIRSETPVRVLIGAEIDADPVNRDGRLLLSDTSGIDVILASTHFLPEDGDPWYNIHGVLTDDRLRALRDEWFTWTMRVAANPKVDILAHPGVEMASIGAIMRFDGEVLDRFEKLLRICARFNTAFELNETLERKIGPLPAESYINVLALARDIGVKLSLGSDAHSPEKIGQYDFVARVVKTLGLTHQHFYHPVSRA